MAATISLYDGTTTVQLNDSTILTTGHPFGTPTMRQDEIELGRDKQNLAVPGYENVTESLELLITGASVAAVQASIQSIEQMLDKARQSVRTWQDARVWLQVQHDGDGSDTWRSEILAGKLEFAEALDQLPRQKVEAVLMLTRRPYFEGARTALELSTEVNSTATTSEVELHITDDATAGERNYIDIDSAQVDGTLPTPIELQVRNAEASAKWWTGYYLANYVHMTPASVDPIYVGSAADPSGASRVWTYDYEIATHEWSISDAQVAFFAGQYVRLIAVVTACPGAYARAAVQYDNGSAAVAVYQARQAVYVSGAGTYDLGVVPLPPGGASADWTGINVAIYGQSEGGTTLTIDHIQLMPAGQGLFRKITQSSFSVPNTLAMVEDGPEGLVYLRTTATGDRHPLLRGYLDPLHIWPGVDNRIRIWFEGATKGDQVEAQAWYRARRHSI